MKAPHAGIWKVRAVIRSPELAPSPCSLSSPRQIVAPHKALTYSPSITPKPAIDDASSGERHFSHCGPHTLSETCGRACLRFARSRSFLGDQVPTNDTSHAYLARSWAAKAIGACSSGL